MTHRTAKLTRQQARRAVAAFFVLVFLAGMWPIYPLFSRIFPMILGVPFSLSYLIFLSLLSFLILFALYLWEDAGGEPE